MSKNFTRILLVPFLFLLGISVSFGQTGNGLDFDGVKDYVSIPDNNLLDFGASNFTIETWVNKRANSSGFNAGVVAKWNTGAFAGTNEWLLQTTSTGGDNIPSFWLESGTTIYQCKAVTPMVLNTWYHLAVVREGTALKIYVNGVLENTLTIPANTIVNNKNLDLTLGAYRFSSNPIFSNMSMDELRIWSRALCTDEIINNKDCELVAGGQTGLVALYHFNQGLASGNNTGIVSTVPDAPSITSVTPGNAQAVVAFTPPASNGGLTILSYKVTSSPQGITAIGSTSPITLTGLTNGVTYTFTVNATNANGASVASASSVSVTPTGPPSAPTNVVATPGNTSATISFTPPVSDGGLTITSYTVVSTPGGFTAVGSSSPIIVLGLTNSVSYTFTVKATNAVGSATSAASNAVVPATVPGAPRITAVAASSSKVTVTFTAPASNGGSAITGYKVTSSPGGITATGAASPIAVTGLTNGITYTFVGVALNAIGSSISSAASTAIAPIGGPLPPTISTVTAGNTVATITFLAPTNNGGSPITSYVAVSTPGGFTATVTTVTPITVSGLTNGQSYTFQVRAVNALGSSAFSTASNPVTPATVPGAPAIQSVTPAANQATIAFTPPANNGGLAIVSYTVTSNPGGKVATSSGSPITVSGLNNGTSYTFTVKATNSLGSGSASAASTAVVVNPVVVVAKRVMITYNTFLQADIDVSTGYALAANQSEYDPISKLTMIAAPVVPYNIIRPADINYLVTYDAATEILTAQNYAQIDIFANTVTDRYGSVYPYDANINKVYKITSDLYLVDVVDETVFLDPVTLNAVAAVGTYTILPTPATLKLDYANAHSLVGNYKQPRLFNNNTEENSIASVIPVSEKPSYLVGPYSYSNASDADHIELSGNLTEMSFSNLLAATATVAANNLTVTTTLIDESGNNLTGTLHGFTLNGNTSNWVLGNATGNCSVFVPATTPVTGNTSVCIGSTTTLQNASAGGVWSSSNTNVATVSATGFVNSISAGTAIISYTNTCGGVSAVTVTVHALPVITINIGNTTICAGTSVTLSGSGASTYVWSDGISDGVSFIPSATNTYSVTGTDVNGCVNTALQTITVNAKPTVSIIADNTTVCAGTEVTLSGSGALTYVWNNGVSDGVSFIPSSTNTYTVTGTDVNGCVNTALQTITVNAKPTVSINADNTTVCAGTAVTLSGSGASTYVWNNGVSDGVSFIPSSTNTYTVTGTDVNGCVNTASQTITVNAKPTVSIIADNTTVCAGSKVTLNGNGASTYVWNNGIVDGVSFIPSATNTYTVTGTDVNGCVNTATVSVSVNPLPSASISGNTNICAGQSTILTASNGSSYLWSTGATTQSITTSIAGSYSVTVTNNNNCSALSAPTIVTVNPTPTIAVSASATAICKGSSTILTATGAQTYVWMPGSLSGASISVSPTASTTYTVTGTSASGCSMGSDWKIIKPGAYHLLAIKTNGSLWLSGFNSYGQLGNGNNTNSSNITQIGNATWTAVTGGNYHSVGIQTNGTLWSWGNNVDGELGNGANTNTNTPQQIGTATWSSITAGAYHTLGIKTDGTLWAWGQNTYGQIGNGSTIRVNSPVQIGSSTWIKVAAGEDFSFGIKNDGTLWAWGHNNFYQLGQGNNTAIISSPVQIGSSTWTEIAAGQSFGLGIKTDATLWSWGYAYEGALGLGAVNPSPNPKQVGSASWSKIAANYRHSFGLKTDNTLYAWGYNANGQLGNGNTTNLNTPTQIGTDVWADIAAGSINGIGIKSSGTLWAWGNNNSGQFGNGNTTSVNSPVQTGIIPTSIAITVNTLPTATISGSKSVCQNATQPLITFTGSTVTAPYTFTYTINGGAQQTVTSIGNTATVSAPTTTSGTFIYTLVSVKGAGSAACSANASGSVTVTVNALPIPVIVAGGPTTICNGNSVSLSAISGAGNMLNFNGTNQKVQINNLDISPSIIPVLTVSAWVKRTGAISSWGAIVSNDDGGYDRALMVNADGNYHIFAGRDINTGIASVIDSWDFMTVSWSASAVTVYQNGVQVFTTSGESVSSGSVGTGIGCNSINSWYFPGSIDQVSFWNNTRSVGQIQTEMNSFLTGSETGIVAFYNFNEGSGVTTADASVTARTGTLVNGPTWSASTISSNQTGSVTYLWSPGGVNTSMISATSTGSYSVTVTNASGCSATTGATTVTVNPLPTATISSGVNVCQNSTSPAITFTGSNGTAPYTFIYTINGGEQQTVVSIGNTATVTAPTGIEGSFTYALISVKDASSTQCTNAAAGSAMITVNSAPTFTDCPANQNATNAAGQCTAVVNYFATATGSSTPTLSYTFSGATTGTGSGTGSGQTFNVGVTTVTITATNTCGSANCSFTVTVLDVTPPTISGPSNITTIASGAAGAVVIYTTPVGTDHCSGTTTLLTAGLPSGATFPIGVTPITYEVTDAAGLKAQCSFTVTVTGLPPVINCPTNITVPVDDGQCGANVFYAATETTAIPASVITYSTASGTFFPVGTTAVTATATNAVGVVSCTFTITVVDDQSPVLIGVPANVTVECDAVPAAAVVTATDNCSTSVPSYTETRTDGNCSSNYILTRTWSTTDASGNTTTRSQMITVQDTKAPILSAAPTDITVECDAVLPAIVTLTATDNCDASPVVTYTEIRTNGNYARNYTLTRLWTATDACGNTSSKTQVITVRDTKAPVPNIILLPTVTAECSATVSAPFATDNCGGLITGTTLNPTSYQTQGTYTITWKFDDGNGNISSQTQQVIIKDLTKPVLIVPFNVTVLCSASIAPVTTGSAKATDNCAGAVIISYSDEIGVNQIIRTWTAIDLGGNSVSANQVITILPLSVTIVSVPVSSVYTGGSSTNLYIGYGSQSTVLQVNAASQPSAGAPYTYSWSGTNLNQLSSTSSSSPIFTVGNTSGYYTYTVTVTNRYGCSKTATISLCVTDVRVPGTNGKVYVCPSSSGNQANRQTLSISVNAVDAHLTGHTGERLGNCEVAPCVTPVTTSATPIITSISKQAETSTATTEEELKVTVMPNPSATYFTLKLESKYETPISMRVMDGTGRVVDAKSKIGANSTIQIGHNYSSGTYYAELIQGNKRKVVQLIKMKG